MQVGWPLVAIHPDHVIALAPPVAGEVGDGHVAADVMPTPAGLEDDVIVLPGVAFLVDHVRFARIDGHFRSPSAKGVGAVEFSVEVAAVRGEFGECFVIHIEILTVGLIAFVDQFDKRAFGKWHRGITVERTHLVELVGKDGGCGEQGGLERVDQGIAETEEVAQGYENAGEGCVVIGDPEQAFAVVLALGHPDVGHLGGTGDVRQDGAGVGWDDPAVGVAPGGIPGGKTTCLAVEDVREVG